MPHRSFDDLKADIEGLARFESLVQLPEKRDPDWPKWSARATRGEKSFIGRGDSAAEGLGALLDSLQ
jgi:hypothetical protein